MSKLEAEIAKRINVTKTHVPNRDRFYSYVDKILDSGWLTNRGELVQELEIKLAEYLGVRNLVLTANGTLALQLAYRALELDGEVITSPFTFVATASSAKWEGLDVSFADIDRPTFNITPKTIEPHITDRTSAILPVHVFGNPCDVEGIDVLAKQHGLKVVYDAAHAFGVKYKGGSILNYGDISVLSFHATKLFHTIEGGALIINDDELCEKVRKMANFGITGSESIECLGINAKMNEFQAAMGLSLLDDIGTIIKRRGEITALYDSFLSDKVVKQDWNDKAGQNYAYYPVVFESEAVTKRVQAALNEQNIFPRRYFYPSLDTLDFISNSQNTLVSQGVARRILCLPLYADLSRDDCSRVSNIILSELGCYKGE